MVKNVNSSDAIEIAIKQFSTLPGLGKRSAQRIILKLLKNRHKSLDGLINILQELQENVVECKYCFNFDIVNPCNICCDQKRDDSVLCVVEDVSDLWALERMGSFTGKYHILGGLISPLDGIKIDDLHIKELFERVEQNNVKEVIIAFNATIDGQSTSHYITQNINQKISTDIVVTKLSQGLPIGGDLDFLDQGTIIAAMNGRRPI